jgi:hypothetical protein
MCDELLANSLEACHGGFYIAAGLGVPVLDSVLIADSEFQILS